MQRTTQRRVICGLTVACATAAVAFCFAFLESARATSPASTEVTFEATTILYGVTCPSVTQCTAVGLVGATNTEEEVTFDPASPGTGAVEAAIASAGAGRPSLACPSLTQCTATIANGGEVTFNPTSPGPANPVTLDNGGTEQVSQLAQLWFSSIACPSMTQCTAVGPASTSQPFPVIRQEVTFNPTSPGTPTPTTIDPGQTGFLTGVSCPSITQCVAVGFGGNVGQVFIFDPTSPGSPIPTTIGAWVPSGVSCPSLSQCTTSAWSGIHSVELTFSPASPGRMTRASLSGSGNGGVSCPSITQCTAWSGGIQATFNPAAPGSPSSTPIIGHVTQLQLGGDLACASTAQCTGVGQQCGVSAFGGCIGAEVAFDPAQPPQAGFAASPSVDGDVASVELTCGGLVGQECTGTIAARAVEELGRGKTVVGVSANRPRHGRSRRVLVGQASFTSREGTADTVELTLNVRGRQLLRRFKRMRARLTITTMGANSAASSTVTTIVTLTTKKPRKVVGAG